MRKSLYTIGFIIAINYANASPDLTDGSEFITFDKGDGYNAAYDSSTLKRTSSGYNVDLYLLAEYVDQKGANRSKLIKENLTYNCKKSTVMENEYQILDNDIGKVEVHKKLVKTHTINKNGVLPITSTLVPKLGKIICKN